MKISLLGALVFVLVGCGGGGAASIPTPTPTPTPTPIPTPTPTPSPTPTPTPTPEACAYDAAVIFEECLPSAWIPAVNENGTPQVLHVGTSGTTTNSTWSVVDLDDADHNNVIDVEFFQETAFADFRFMPIVENGSTISDLTTLNLSEYADGVFAFDLRVLDYGLGEHFGIYMNIQCEWPCRSMYFPVASYEDWEHDNTPGFPVQLETNTWVEIRIPVTMLTADNLNDAEPDLDLSLIDVISIAPPWASSISQTDIHYQIDNIRFEHQQSP